MLKPSRPVRLIIILLSAVSLIGWSLILKGFREKNKLKGMQQLLLLLMLLMLQQGHSQQQQTHKQQKLLLLLLLLLLM